VEQVSASLESSESNVDAACAAAKTAEAQALAFRYLLKIWSWSCGLKKLRYTQSAVSLYYI